MEEATHTLLANIRSVDKQLQNEAYFALIDSTGQRVNWAYEMKKRFARPKKLWIVVVFLLLAISGCQFADQPPVILTTTPTRTASPTVGELPTSTAIATSTPKPTLSPQQPWLAYYSGTSSDLSLVNQDGSALTVLSVRHTEGYDGPPLCFYTNAPKEFGILPTAANPLNRMTIMGKSIRIVQPPDTLYIYNPEGECPWCCPQFGFRLNQQDDLLAVFDDTTETVPTLFIYELPSMKIREHLPLIKSKTGCATEIKCDIRGQIAWSPDGRYLAFPAAWSDDPSTDLYIYDSETRTTRQLTSDPNWISFFWWSPDSARLLFGEASEPGRKACVKSVSAVSIEKGQIRHLYDPKYDPDQGRFACQQGLFEWIDNTKFLITDGGRRTFEPGIATTIGVAARLRLVDVSTGQVKPVFNGFMYGVELDGEKKTMLVDGFGDNHYGAIRHLVSLADLIPHPVLTNHEDVHFRWDAGLRLFRADGSSVCHQQIDKIPVVGPDGVITCVKPAIHVQTTPFPTYDRNADGLTLSPNKQWRVLLNWGSVSIEELNTKSQVVVMKTTATQVIWCPDSTCFFLFGNRVLYHVSFPDFNVKMIDNQFIFDDETIYYRWLYATEK